ADFNRARIALRANRRRTICRRSRRLGRSRRWRRWRRRVRLLARMPADSHLQVVVIAEHIAFGVVYRISCLRRHVPADADAAEKPLLRLHGDADRGALDVFDVGDQGHAGHVEAGQWRDARERRGVLAELLAVDLTRHADEIARWERDAEAVAELA